MNRQVWHLPVDSIMVERSGISVCLSNAMRRVEGWAAAMEENLVKAFAGIRSQGSITASGHAKHQTVLDSRAALDFAPRHRYRYRFRRFRSGV